MNSFTLVKRHIVYTRLLHNYLVTFSSSFPFFSNVMLVYSFRYYLVSIVYVYLYDGLFFQYLGLCCCVESRLDSETSDKNSIWDGAGFDPWRVHFFQHLQASLSY
jgi:hypothetical protein